MIYNYYYANKTKVIEMLYVLHMVLETSLLLFFLFTQKMSHVDNNVKCLGTLFSLKFVNYCFM